MPAGVKSDIDHNPFSIVRFSVKVGNETKVGFVGHLTDVNISKPSTTLFVDVRLIPTYPFLVTEVSVLATVNGLDGDFSGTLKLGRIVEFQNHPFSLFSLKLFG